MYHHAEVVEGLTRSHSVRSLMDQVSRMNSHDMHSKDFSGVLSVNHLCHSIRLLHSQSFRVALKRSLGDSDLVSIATLLCFLTSGLLINSHEADFRMSEASGRYISVVDDVFSPHDVFNGADTLSRRGVSKHVLAVCISDSINVVKRLSVLTNHLHFIIDCDEPASKRFDSEVLESKAFSVWATSSGDHDSVNLKYVLDFLCRRICELDFDTSEGGWGYLGCEDVGVVVYGLLAVY
mmetsp:Transcript_19078/g.26671  ORF Transcript_19078/g.26671 Transcript_19078/m.26671 type:complete len:236 (-) Transcript_19078:1184-1891(-)